MAGQSHLGRSFPKGVINGLRVIHCELTTFKKHNEESSCIGMVNNTQHIQMDLVQTTSKEWQAKNINDIWT